MGSKINETRYDGSDNSCVIDLLFRPDGLYEPVYGNKEHVLSTLQHRAETRIAEDAYIRTSIDDALDTLGWVDSEVNNPLLRALIYGATCSYRDQVRRVFDNERMSKAAGTYTVVKANLQITSDQLVYLYLGLEFGEKKVYDEDASKKTHRGSRRRER